MLFCKEKKKNEMEPQVVRGSHDELRARTTDKEANKSCWYSELASKYLINKIKLIKDTHDMIIVVPDLKVEVKALIIIIISSILFFLSSYTL